MSCPAAAIGSIRFGAGPRGRRPAPLGLCVSARLRTSLPAFSGSAATRDLRGIAELRGATDRHRRRPLGRLRILAANGLQTPDPNPRVSRAEELRPGPRERLGAIPLRRVPFPVTGSPFSLVAHYFGPALAFGVCHSICFKWSLCPACVFDALSVALDYRATLSYIFSVKEIAYSRTAQKALTRMPRNWAERIMEKIRAYAEDPESQANNITGLKGSDSLSRLRVGDWRIIMRSGVVLHVLDVTIRGSAYKE